MIMSLLQLAHGKRALICGNGGEHLVDALEFLDKSKKANCRIDLGETIAIIGGGDVAWTVQSSEKVVKC